jgi:methylmalonic aciduria homocystinuria type C protein
MLLVGNGRALWERFRHEMRSEPERLQSPHPLDEFVERSLSGCLADSAVSATVVYGHRRYAGGYAPLQRWAVRAGALALSPSHLSVHPVVGPWLALRALIVFDEVERDACGTKTANAEVERGARGTKTANAEVERGARGANTANAEVERGARGTTEREGLLPPCAACDAPCLSPFERARLISAATPTDQRVTDHWKHWLAVRDACPFGREYRYTDAQIRYHYARDRSVF